MEKNTKSLLAIASTCTRASEIRALVSAGADVNCVNEWGMTPLMLAAQYNHCLAVVKVLLTLGADLSIVEPKYKSTALHLAAANSKNPEIIQTLINAGADVEQKNYLGETPLIMAVSMNENTKISTHLIKLGADVLATDYQGHTVYEYAVLNKKTYLTTVLKTKIQELK